MAHLELTTLEQFTHLAALLLESAQTLADDLANAEVRPLHVTARLLELPEVHIALSQAEAGPEELSRRCRTALATIGRTGGKVAQIGPSLLVAVRRAEKLVTSGKHAGVGLLLDCLAQAPALDDITVAVLTHRVSMIPWLERIDVSSTQRQISTDGMTRSATLYLGRAQELADASRHAECRPIHLLAKLLEMEGMAARIKERGGDVDALRERCRHLLDLQRKVDRPATVSVGMFALIRRAKVAVSPEEVTLAHLLGSLCVETADGLADTVAWLAPPDDPPVPPSGA